MSLLTYVLIVLCFFSILISTYLFFLLVRIQRRLRSVLSVDKTSQPYALDFFLDHVVKQKEIVKLNTSGLSIANKQELNDVLLEITSMAHKVLNCEFIELCLVDAETEIYHSACSIGKPVKEWTFQTKYLQEIQAINFAGKRFGFFRIVFKSKKELYPEIKEHIELIASQAAVAVLNARYSEELIDLQHQSEESVKAKTGFLANLSHELRGPLGNMLNAVEIVLTGIAGDVNELQTKTLSMVKKNGEHLLDLINDVLDYAKVEAGKIIPDKQALNVKELVEDVAKLVNSQAVKKKHKLSTKVLEADLVMSCDRRHARQILINFLTNAIKYTPEGGQIEFTAERSSNNKVKISVKDNGVGISEDQKSRVFSAFDRLDNEYSNRQAGTGLGLSLTIKLVEANGGKIGFDSVEGEGSTFWVDFDAMDVSELGEEKTEELAQIKQGEGKRILLFEPELDEVNAVQNYLNDLGYQVTHLSSSDLSVLKTSEYSLAIIENNLLDDSDVNFLRDLRTFCQQPKLPVVLLTSRAFEFDVESYLKMGVDICLQKPFQLPEIARKIQELV